MNQKLKLLILLLAAVFFAFPEPAQAVGSLTVNGRWAGTAFANPAFDLSGDGLPARTFDLKVFETLLFGGIEGVVDVALVGVNQCAPGAFELKPFGKFTFRGRLGDGLFAEVDPAAPNLCFDPAHPNEVLAIRFTGGTGAYEHATGTGTLTLHDHSRFPDPAVDPAAYPLMVDTLGEFVLHINL